MTLWTPPRRVLEIESTAVAGLATALPEDFGPAVEAVLATTGRVILSGIGKSGHIARKISSTFASTGTPSAFVHPAEASHGDLGMVTPGDLVILISNSGETAELRDIVAHVTRFSIPMIGISGKPGSTLMQAGGFPPSAAAAPRGLHQRACADHIHHADPGPWRCAGDCGHGAARVPAGGAFRNFHPGGRLGAQLAKVAQLMHGPDELPLVMEDTPMPEALIEMTEKSFGITGVTSGGKLVGVITDGDLRRNVDRLSDALAGDVATRTPLVIGPEEFLQPRRWPRCLRKSARRSS